MKKKVLGLALIAGLALGSFAATTYANDLDPSPMGDMAIGDIIGDEKPDIVYICEESYYDKKRGTRSYLAVKENLGNGEYKEHMLDITVYGKHGSGLGGYKNPRQVDLRIADMNGDGLNDIIVKNEGYIILFENKGNLQFEEKEL